MLWLGVALLAAALCVRLVWQNRTGPAQPITAALGMDDSRAELPLAPPGVPADNAAALKAARERLDRAAADTTLQGKERLAAAALGMGDLWRAEAAACSALKIAPKDRSARLTLAASLRQQDRFDPASMIYRQLIAEDRHDSDAYLGMADTMFAANRRPDAFAWLARAASDGAQTALSLTTIAHRYQDWKDYPKAEETAGRALKAAPDDIDARLELASIQVESGRLDDARHSLDAILTQDPKNGLAYRLLGVVLMNATYSRQDLNGARRVLERAVELNPRDPNIYSAAAVVYREQRLYRLAAQAYDALLQLDPTSLEGRYGLGQVYGLLSKPELSRRQLALYEQLDERQRRVTRLSEDALHNPRQAGKHAALARYLESSGDYARALPQYQTAAGLDPNDRGIQRDLTRFYARLGWGKPVHESQ
ncbi:MAG TPA: tetratricopeptide repeat protein [Chthonomonadaceae bacterium]|nr:tetratricopeptide repeat protein [Chthonomonadaceae bacterium]